MEEVRLQRYLAQSGVASRRKAEELISAGRVKVNGKTVTVLGTKVAAGRDLIAVDGKAVHPQDLYYVVLNKPKGCISAVNDPEGRPTVMEYLPGVPAQVFPVGRLDFNSEGVLLFTNDGELAQRLLSPRRHVDKTYHVKIQGSVSDRALSKLRAGVKLDDGRVTREAQIDRLKARSKHEWLVITISEGRNRQIHRMMDAVGHQVSKLQRVAFAGISFHGLRVGDARELSAQEVKTLRTHVKLSPDSRVSTKGKWFALREDTDQRRKDRIRQRREAAGETAPAKKKSRKKEVAPSRRGVGRGAKSGAGKPGGTKKRGAKAATASKPKRAAKPASASRPKRGAAPSKTAAAGRRSGPPKGGSKPSKGRGSSPARGRKASTSKRKPGPRRR